MMKMSENKLNNFFKICTLIFALITIALGIIYLLTNKMIPGLSPLCLAILMICIFFNDNATKKFKITKLLCIIAAGLNIITGILQIVTAIIKG